MKRLFAAALIASCIAPLPALAAPVDLAQMKCTDLANVSDEDGPALFMWLVGYVSGKHELTAIDFDQAGNAGNAMGEYCASNPDATLIEAAEATFK